MKLENLAELLPTMTREDYVVTFTDGDSYEIRDLDIQGYYHDYDETVFEICVTFDKCLDRSRARQQALVNWELNRREMRRRLKADWPQPTGKRYLIEEIEHIFDRERNFHVYEREVTG